MAEENGLAGVESIGPYGARRDRRRREGIGRIGRESWGLDLVWVELKGGNGAGRTTWDVTDQNRM